MNKKSLDSKNLVKVLDVNKNIRFDLRYAGKNNFTKKKLYKKPICLLRKKAAIALSKAQKKLEKRGLGLLLWDCYRPPKIQKKLRKVFDDENLVPKVSNHSKGIAVDLTLCQKDGACLKMPTEFDDFSKKAGANYTHLSEERIKNRDLLKRVMEEEGFKQSKLEWWHFDFLKIKNPRVIYLKI